MQGIPDEIPPVAVVTKSDSFGRTARHPPSSRKRNAIASPRDPDDDLQSETEEDHFLDDLA